MVRAVLLGTALFAACASADTIELKTGERLDGTFRRADASGIVIEIAGQSITIQLEKVQAIYFGTPKPAAVSNTFAPYAETLDALRALRSITQSGVSYSDYASRVLDAKIKVDKYLSSATNDEPEFRNAIGVGMREYELASQAWSLKFSHGAESLPVMKSVGKTLNEDSEISKCPGVQQLFDQMAQTLKGRSYSRLSAEEKRTQGSGTVAILVGERPGLLWTCAADHVTKAEGLVTQH